MVQLTLNSIVSKNRSTAKRSSYVNGFKIFVEITAQKYASPLSEKLLLFHLFGEKSLKVR